MAHRRLNSDPRSSENGLPLGKKHHASGGGNIKDKISLWEGKEAFKSSFVGLRSTGEQSEMGNVRGVQVMKSHYDKDNMGKHAEWRPPVEKQQTGNEDNTAYEEHKENVETLDSRPCFLSPPKDQLRTLTTTKTSEQSNQEKRAVFTLFQKLDAMGQNDGKTAPEVGNYFSPPSKDKQPEGKRKDNVSTDSGSSPVNPLPKPKRTFQHPATKGQRNLPPLPKTASRPSPGANRGRQIHHNRKTLKGEDIPVSKCSPTLEHHYEDILDKENPYEDIELESQCSQQSSLPSSPGADTSKASRPGFFRQNSGRTFKLLDLRRGNQQNHSGSSGVASPSQLSPPSTPTDTPWSSSDPYSCTYRRIPTLVQRINSIFEARIGKKHLRRIYHYAETSSGRVTDENSDSEREFEERAKGRQHLLNGFASFLSWTLHSDAAHRQRLVSVQSILGQPSHMGVQCNSTKARNMDNNHHRQLFEYFLVVSLQKAKTGGHYIPEVTQQFPPKMERNFKFLRETEDQLKIIPKFCFPDAKDWEPADSYPSEMFSFVLTGEDGSRRFGYCRRLLPNGRGKRLPEVYCIVSRLGCFKLFSKVLDEVERRRALSPALVQPFMRAIMEAQFPAPGRTITVKTFLPGSGTEVMELCRPSDSHLEHVDFECLFSCLSLRLLLRVFGSLLFERRVIFTADKLSTLSQCCHAVVALLYPFVWQHTYIPVLPSAMLDIVCTPTPFIVGLLCGSLPQLNELPLEEVLVVDLGKSRFLKQMDDEDSILPSKLHSALENVLERRRELAGGDHLSTVVSEAFVRFFVELVGHYPLFFFSEREDDVSSMSSVPCSFQREAFRKAVPSKTTRRFLEVFMETQMFGWFIQERELNGPSLRGLFEMRVHEYLDTIHESEHRRVNRFLKGLGNRMKFLSKK
ncbi:DENN domain-containing protein 2A-like isoform X1 [Phyllopteryx taeniolatus]|uniref:DENN domain-containing protein 2A-like isoform X1 n=1 Tax=Phyllopteryx taeniolatus TaxID=161469 RepID=UPI002AD27063|nr:DENN domain-containing protein 2A-like isoform X1 [Phyllopteryx taeniolatus]